ncbi:MAG: hypothetical protein HeimC3_07490 [Candidatus Heimdallarchaeota archaeon LC_3]|nr:MAG: hypothetical protein HeimC3_07490 [Candidatus Heimdallarchaeota archaeon LC_3]
MISDIIEGYFKTQSFFEINNNYNNVDQIRKKEILYRELSHEFYKKYAEIHNKVLKGDLAKTYLEDFNTVMIPFKNGSFLFPTSFKIYIDNLKDINNTPIRKIDASILDSYMNSFDPSLGLEKFLSEFFDVIKSIRIPLRSREVELFHLLTDINFLSKNVEGKPRIVPPTDNEMIPSLGFDNKKKSRVNRAFRFLKSYRVCYLNTIIMNPSKFGFDFLSFDYPKDYPEIIKKVSDFIFWEIPFQKNNTVIACIPSGESDKLLDFESYYLDNWSWNLNLKSFQPEKHDPLEGWKTFQIPDFNSTNRISNFVSWDLTKSNKNELRETEIEILRNLTRSNNFSINSITSLSKSLSPGGIDYILKNLAKNDIYRIYPGINHIGLNYYNCIKFQTHKKELFENLLHSILSFPIAHVFSNRETGIIICYFHVPKNFLTDVLINIRMFSHSYPSVKVEISDPFSYPKINRVPKLFKYDFKVTNGIAYLKN